MTRVDDGRDPAPAPDGPPADGGRPADEAGSGRAADEAGSGRAADEDVPAEIAALASSVAALDELADRPVAGHVARYDALHGELSEALASIDGI